MANKRWVRIIGLVVAGAGAILVLLCASQNSSLPLTSTIPPLNTIFVAAHSVWFALGGVIVFIFGLIIFGAIDELNPYFR
jgi:hypothetical protein